MITALGKAFEIRVAGPPGWTTGLLILALFVTGITAREITVGWWRRKRRRAR